MTTATNAAGPLAPLSVDDGLLMSFADGALEPAVAQLMEAQVAADPALARRLAVFRQSGDWLRAAFSTPDQLEVPPALAARIAAMPEQSEPRGRLIPFRRRAWISRVWIPLALAASVAGFLLGSSGIVQKFPLGGAPASGARQVVLHIMDEVADYHAVYAAEKEHLVEVPASRKDHLEAWLGDRLKFALKIPDLSARDLTFQGGRLLAIDHRPVAQLIYTGRDGAAVALCVALTEHDASFPLMQQRDEGLSLFGTGMGRHVFVVVGPSANPALRDLAAAMPGLLKRS